MFSHDVKSDPKAQLNLLFYIDVDGIVKLSLLEEQSLSQIRSSLALSPDIRTYASGLVVVS